MISDAFLMSGLSAFAVITLYKKFPKRVQKFALKHVLLTDVVLMVATVNVFGLTATGIMAGAMLDVWTTIAIHVANHPDDFQYIYDFNEFAGNQLSSLQKTLNEFGKSYKDNKAAQTAQG